jgi:hypothetical protein
MSIRECLLKFKQDSSMYTLNPLLDAIDLDIIEHMELQAISHPFLKKAIVGMESLLSHLTIAYSNQWGQLLGIYCEAALFLHLLGFVSISKRPEGAAPGPDYAIHFRGKDFFAELKCPVFVAPQTSYPAIFKEALSKRIEADEAIKRGHRVVITEQSVDPYHLNARLFNLYPKMAVITTLIDKLEQNYKEGQYLSGNTLLFADLRQLGTTTQSWNCIQPYYTDRDSGVVISGELWNVAFGTIGSQILTFPTSHIYGNVEGPLEKQGLIVAHPLIRALVFQVNSIRKGASLVALHRNKDYEIHDLLQEFCDYTNDETNANGYMLSNWCNGA